MVRWGVVLASLMAAMAILAGCGGGGGTGGTESSGASTASTGAEESTGGEERDKEGEKEKPSPEKAALTKEGDEICWQSPANYNKKVQSLEKENGGKKPPTKEVNLKAAVPPLYTAIEEFEELTAPSGEEVELEAVISSLGAAAKGLEEKPASEPRRLVVAVR